MKEEKNNNEAPGQNKEANIIVNGTQEVWSEKKISFRELVDLAFPAAPANPDTVYTVTYAKGPEDNLKGSLVDGRDVRVKEGMVFNVTQTNKS